MTFSNRYLYLTMAAASTIALTAGCSTKPEEKKEPAAIELEPVQSVCGGLLGDTGGTAVAKLTGERKVRPTTKSEGRKFEAATKTFGTPPQRGDDQESKLASLCSFTALREGVPDTKLDIKFGWGSLPEASPEVPVHHWAYIASYSAGDWLFRITGNEDSETNDIYYTCRTSAGVGTVRGTFEWPWSPGKLSGKERDVNRARVLLPAASRMSEALGCTNKPNLSPDSEFKRIPDKSLDETWVLPK